MEKKLILSIIFILSLFIITGCGENKLNKITLNVDKLIPLNETKKIEVEYSPKGFNEEITWSSSNEEIATVDKGIITPKKVGEVTITATTETGISSNINVKVYQKAEKILLNKTKVNLTIKETDLLKATIIPDNATYKDITWDSSNAEVVEINDGIIKANGKGNAIVTATTEDGTIATCNVEVEGTKANMYFNNKVRWGMSIDEIEETFGKGDNIYREPDVYAKYEPTKDDYHSSFIKYYVYWFRNNQLRAYWLNYEDTSCSYNVYLDIKDVLSKKYGKPSKEQYKWKDKTYKNNKEKWSYAFTYDDFIIKTTWKKSNYNIVISWDHSSENCSLSYSQKEYTSLLY